MCLHNISLNSKHFVIRLKFRWINYKSSLLKKNYQKIPLFIKQSGIIIIINILNESIVVCERERENASMKECGFLECLNVYRSFVVPTVPIRKKKFILDSWDAWVLNMQIVNTDREQERERARNRLHHLYILDRCEAVLNLNVHYTFEKKYNFCVKYVIKTRWYWNRTKLTCALEMYEHGHVFFQLLCCRSILQNADYFH